MWRHACRDGWIEVAEVEHSVGFGDVCMIKPHFNVGVDAPDASYVENLQASGKCHDTILQNLSMSCRK